MSEYDAFAEEYDQAVTQRGPVIECAYNWVLEHIGDVVHKSVCDLGCGQGELSRRIAALGASVTGVDYSSRLLKLAADYSTAFEIRWIHDDAQVLAKIPSGKFDTVVANLMLMDIPDFTAVFHSTYRILTHNGRVIWTITHPCFQSPYSEPVPDDGVFRFRVVKTYEEKWWKSGGSGTIRSTLGAYHRPLSRYLNAFLEAGFRIDLISEPTANMDMILSPKQMTHTTIPPILGVIGSKLP